ncbi:MAG: ribosome small subunit-dependent GTPase A [Oscillospiraceae bacterium]|nr:ribosome small subunit-dependent GTPase A [Oscillospiraceae bacterium]
MTEGIITRGIGGFYYVAHGDETVTCKARGRFRLDGIAPLPGDRVRITVKNGEGRLEEILPRKNVFTRPPVANLDALVMVASIAPPVSGTLWIDKILGLALQKGVTPILCLNKSDIGDTSGIAEMYASIGYTVVRTAVPAKEGIDELREAIRGKILAFSGHSGVGKSSILNILLPEANMPIGEVSERLGRGRHTTRHVELFKMGEDTWLADTPGFSAFDDLDLGDKRDIKDMFPEFEGYSCRFSDCAHIGEGADCGVINAVRDGGIYQSRYDSYKKLCGSS